MNRARFSTVGQISCGEQLGGQDRDVVSVPGETQILPPSSVPSGLIDSLVLHSNASVVFHVESTNTPRSVPSASPQVPTGQYERRQAVISFLFCKLESLLPISPNQP